MRRPWRKRNPWSPGWWLMGGAAGGGAVPNAGPIASLPTNVAPQGSTYVCTDSPYTFVSLAGVWTPFAFGFKVVQPVLANFTQVNVALSTFDTTHGGIIWSVPTGSNNYHIQSIGQAIPATPYYVDTAFVLQTGQPGGCGAGPGIFNGLLTTSALEFGCYGMPNSGNFGSYQTQYFTLPTGAGGAGLFTWQDVIVAPMIWQRIYDDGTNLTFYVSPNGYTWQQMFQEPRATHLTPADLGLVVQQYGGTSYVHFLHFSVHT